MSYLRKYEVIPVDTYKIIRQCSGCGCKSTFVSTNNFRVNANGNKIDVWLIYQCSKCRHTYNLTIYERIKAKDLNQEEYNKILSNDTDLAYQYGVNTQLMKKNKAKIDWSNVIYKINNISQDEEILESCIAISNPFGIKIRTDKILSEILHVSRSEIKKWIQDEKISIESASLRYITKVKCKDK